MTAEETLGQARMWQELDENGKAEALLRRGAEAGSAAAAFELADLLAGRGEIDAARDHYGQAAARGDADLAAEARRRLHSLP
ncbi:hypothetical protein GCM10023195_14380 [Actinoallomurus liliacearum]|uniref:Tetratrico peptide repeat group 5 domain-containing protein n=1 Tax=Actinoallomurus liliacearum TaxID=1080073 RepID=A0ABP8TFN7_9ACTN